MTAIIIKAGKKSSKILSDLAKKLGGNVVPINDEQYEDFSLGTLMDKVKTNETISREQVMKKLRNK